MTSIRTALSNPRAPHIFLKDGKDYSKVRDLFVSADITFHGRLVENIIRITVRDEGQFRLANSILKAEKIPYFSFLYDAAKMKTVVIKGLIVELSESEIADDIRDKHFDVFKVTRMKKGPERRPIPVVLVKYQESCEETLDIFQVKTVLRLNVKVQVPRARPDEIANVDPIHTYNTNLTDVINAVAKISLDKTTPNLPDEILSLIKEKNRTRKRWMWTRDPAIKTTLNQQTERIKYEVKKYKNSLCVAHI